MRLIDADALIACLLTADNQRETDWMTHVVYAQPTITDKEVIAEFLKQGTFKIHIPEPEPFPEPIKRGRWEYMYHDDAPQDYCIKCSACGDYFLPENLCHAKNYCPNCGARMENEDETD